MTTLRPSELNNWETIKMLFSNQLLKNKDFPLNTMSWLVPDEVPVRGEIVLKD